MPPRPAAPTPKITASVAGSAGPGVEVGAGLLSPFDRSGPFDVKASDLAKTNADIARDSTGALMTMLPLKTHLKPAKVGYRRDRDPLGEVSQLDAECAVTGLVACDSAVERQAFARHLAAIEDEANRIQGEQVVFHKLLAQGRRRRGDASTFGGASSARVEGTATGFLPVQLRAEFIANT